MSCNGREAESVGQGEDGSVDSRRVTRSEEEFLGGVLEGRWAGQPEGLAVALSALFLSCFTKCGN